MKTAKDIALIGVYTALLIGAQFVLSSISGVELVTVLLLSFAFNFGIVRGLCVASAFSLLRCIVFGFFPNVLILYLIYYNLFALLFGLIGLKTDRKLTKTTLAVLTLSALLMTALFTALDDIITPLYYGFDRTAFRAYAAASLTALIPQSVCTLITVTALSPVIIRVFSLSKRTKS